MTFEYPGFLYFLLLVFIPVIIHLFNLRKSKKVVFSNTKLLTQVKSASKSKTKVQRWLILLSRMLFVICLVLAFAQPKEKTPPNTVEDNASKIIVIDNSLSMQLNSGEGENLEVIKNVLLSSLKKNLNYTIISNSGFSKNGSGKELEEYISSLAYSNNQKSFSKFQDKIDRYEEELAVYFFSDFQSGVFDVSALNTGRSEKVYLIPLENEKISNVYVDSLWIDRPFPQVGQTIKLSVRIKNSGDVNEKSVGVKLDLNGMQQGATLIELKANEVKQLDFDITLTSDGFNTGKVNIDDGSIYFDNDFYYCVNTTNKINIALVTSKKEPYISQVYNDTLFNLKEYSLQDAQTIDFNAFDYLVLDELNQLPDFLIEGIAQSHVVTMLVPSSDDFDIRSYEAFFQAMGVSDVIYRGTNDTLRDIGHELISPEFENPFFQGMFEKEDENMEMPYAIPQYNWSGGNHLLQNKNGEPVLTHFIGNKEVYVWAVPFKSNLTNIATHSLFLPIMYKAATSSLDVENKIYHTFGENSLAYKGDFTTYRDKLKLMKDGKELANAKISSVKMLFELPSNNLPSGIFEVGIQDSVFYKVAINFPKEESIMNFTSVEGLKSQVDSIPFFDVKPLTESIDELEASIGNKDNTFPYWKICLILSLMFLLGETLLIRYYK